MSDPTRALHFIGKLDRRQDSMVLNENAQRALLDRLLVGRDPQLHDRIHGFKAVRDVYSPPTRGVDGKHKVMPRN